MDYDKKLLVLKDKALQKGKLVKRRVQYNHADKNWNTFFNFNHLLWKQDKINYHNILEGKGGNSMSPLLNEKTVLTEKKASFNSIKSGDLVVFKLSNGLEEVHRVIRKQHDSLISKGDFNLWFDAMPRKKHQLKSKIILLNNQNMNTIRWKIINKLIASFSSIQGTIFKKKVTNPVIKNFIKFSRNIFGDDYFFIRYNPITHLIYYILKLKK